MPVRSGAVLIASVVTVTAAIIAQRTPNLTAQTAPPQSPDQPVLEVASVKRNTTGSVFSVKVEPGGRFVATAVTLQMLMGIAYALEDFQLAGTPPWFKSDRFDIEARGAVAPADVTASARGWARQVHIS